MRKSFKKIMIAITLLMTLAANQSFSAEMQNKKGFMPKNNLYISPSSLVTNGMTEEKFHAIIGRVFDVYAPIVKDKGGIFSTVNRWDDGTVNAYAYQSGNMWVINLFGGLARHPLVTDDGFMLVVCHETGHHLGGAPKYAEIKWATNEGQADYFATLKCMKRLLQNDDNIAAISKIEVDKEVEKKCDFIYKSVNEAALCKRIAMAGESLALLLSSIGDNSKIAFNTPDKKIVKETDDAHPEPQCRLDTFFAGTLCDKSFSEDLSETNPVTGTCVKKDGHLEGVRPLCWYRPAAEE